MGFKAVHDPPALPAWTPAPPQKPALAATEPQTPNCNAFRYRSELKGGARDGSAPLLNHQLLPAQHQAAPGVPQPRPSRHRGRGAPQACPAVGHLRCSCGLRGAGLPAAAPGCAARGPGGRGLWPRGPHRAVRRAMQGSAAPAQLGAQGGLHGISASLRGPCCAARTRPAWPRLAPLVPARLGRHHRCPGHRQPAHAVHEQEAGGAGPRGWPQVGRQQAAAGSEVAGGMRIRQHPSRPNSGRVLAQRPYVGPIILRSLRAPQDSGPVRATPPWRWVKGQAAPICARCHNVSRPFTCSPSCAGRPG